MAVLRESTRVAAAWTQTSGAGKGIAVVSYYGISGANSNVSIKKESEWVLTALWKYLVHYRDKPILLCMGSNIYLDKSHVIQAMTHA